MDGYQITFYTQQDKRVAGRPIAEWLLDLARELDLPGATLIAATEGFGQHRRLHSAHFFELADQPQEIQVAVAAADAERLFARLAAEGVELFYVKSPVEFGVTGR
jgi:PII-like signaling protein